MLDRASTFADPKIVNLLQTRFVPVAIDQFYQRQQKDAEGDFYRNIAAQGPWKDYRRNDSRPVHCNGRRQAVGVQQQSRTRADQTLLEDSLKDFQPVAVPLIKPGAADPRFAVSPPQGGLVVRVTAKVLGGYEETDDEWQKIFQSALSRDNLWIRKDEHQALCVASCSTA